MTACLPQPAVIPAHAYASMAYAETLRHVGRPLEVAAWGTPILLRAIPGAGARMDAVGPYPLCTLAPDADIAAGLQTLREAGAVSVVLVPDPLHGPDLARLAHGFTLCRPFKTHQAIDRRVGPPDPSKHHRDRIRKGRRHARARIVSLRDAAWRAQWRRLYTALVLRRGVTGLAAFPDDAFERLATLPEHQLVAFAAESLSGDMLAMQLWIRHADAAYSHLTAISDAGYRTCAGYVVYDAAIEHFADCRILDLGGGAGVVDDPGDTLAAFKRGFANTTLSTRLCGAVLDPVQYAVLSAARSGPFFPVYRAPDDDPSLRASHHAGSEPASGCA